MRETSMQTVFDPQYALVALMDKTGEEVCQWLRKNLFRFTGNMWWKRNVCGVLNGDEQKKIQSQGWAELQDFDVHLILKVLERNYRFLKTKLSLPNDGVDLIYEVRKIRNRCVGHRPIRGNDHDQLLCDIRTLEIFCTTILNAPHLAKEFKCLSEQASEKTQSITLDSGVKSQPSVAFTQRSEYDQPFVSPQQDISLQQMFSDVELTPSQKKAVQSIEAFLKDDKQNCFVLKGYAGTGKTFLIGGIVRYLKQCKKTPQLLAPTGRAAHVMKERHKVPASTIHRHIYVMDKLREFREIGQNGAVTYKFYYELRNNDTQHDSVFIVDEASMLSDVYTEAEFMRFGSGRLLRDLLEYINFDGNDYRKKIIFVGDDAQLPPVDMNCSPALDSVYLAKYVRSKPICAELIDVVRQKESSLIYKNATALRAMLASENYSAFDFESDEKTVLEISPEEFVANYLAHVACFGTETSIIITYSNALAKDYNTAVRQHLYPNGNLLEANDRVMVVRNNYKYEIDLFNGQAGTVLSVGNDVETHDVFVNVGLDDKGNRKNVNIKLRFRKAVVRFTNLDGTLHDVPCIFIADLLTSSHRELSSEQSKALYVDFKQRHRDMHPGSAEFRQALMSDPYFNALQMKYAYAVTCHKAQGGEWDSAYIDFQHQNKLNPMCIRWSYTALTRAAKTVVATNALHHSLLKPVKQKPTALHSLPNGTSKTIKSDLCFGFPDFLAQESFIDKQIYSHLKELLPAKYSIDSHKAGNYLAQWGVSQDGHSCLIKVHYNGKLKITNVLMDKVIDSDWAQPLQAAVANLKGVKLAAVIEKMCLSPFQTLNSIHHSEFVNAVKSRCEDLHLSVQKIEDMTCFHTRFTYEKGDEIFMVNYYFDSKNQFTSMHPEDGLPDYLLEVLDSIHFNKS